MRNARSAGRGRVVFYAARRPMELATGLEAGQRELEDREEMSFLAQHEKVAEGLIGLSGGILLRLFNAIAFLPDT